MRRRAIVTVAVLLFLPTRSFAATLRIGVFGLFRPQELILSPAPNSALLVEGGGVSLVLEDGRPAHFLISGDFVECRAGSHVLKATAFRASSRAGDAADLILAVPGRIERQYRGNLEIRASREELVAIIEMDREVAVASAVAAESPPGASIEALKAQAVVTRSYYVATRDRHRAYDFCDTTHCQFLREPPAADSPASLATAKTRGLGLGYKDSVLAALFSACCGGRTHSLQEVGLPSEGYPYFPVNCPPCLRRARRWETRLDRDAAAPLLAEESSERARLQVGRKLGWNAVPGINYSARFEGESVVVQGSGAGHGLGLCQTGAAAMAEEGAAFQEILNHYFRNTYIRSASK